MPGCVKRAPLNLQRRIAVLETLEELGATSVIDLGCGKGELVGALLSRPRFARVAGMDVSSMALTIAARELKLDRMPDGKRARLSSSRARSPTPTSGCPATTRPCSWRSSSTSTRPGWPRSSRSCSGRPARHRAGDHAEHRVQRPLRGPHRAAPPRPPFRVDPRRVRRLGRPGWPVGTATVPPSGPSARPTLTLGPPTQMAVFIRDRAIRSRARPSSVLVGVSRQRQVDVRRQALQADQVISSDFCRGLVADDENDQTVTPARSTLLHYIVGMRLAAGCSPSSTPPTCSPPPARAWSTWPRSTTCWPTAIVLDVPEEVAVERNATRPDRDFGAPGGDPPAQGPAPLARPDLPRGLPQGARAARRRGDRRARRSRTRSGWNDRRELTGPFDIIGDVHGCRAELESLLGPARLEDAARGRRDPPRGPHGRVRRRPGRPRPRLARRAAPGHGHGGGRHGAVRGGQPRGQAGPRPARAARSRSRTACAESLDQLAAEPTEFRRGRALAFMDGLISHYVLDGGRLVVAHAGLKEAYHGRASGRVRAFALYGDTTGETDEYGLPVRYPWARGLPRPGHGRLRPHARSRGPSGSTTRSASTPACVFGGSADRAALPRARARPGAGRAGVVRAGPAARPGRPAARARRCCDIDDVPAPGTRDHVTPGGSRSPRRTRPRRWRS